MFYMQYFEIVPLTPDFVSDPRFVSIFVYFDNSRVLSTSSSESGVEVIRSRTAGFGARSRLVDVYIYQLYVFSHDRLVYSL